MRIIQSKKLNVNGLDIHYLKGGQGDPLIIIHGGSDGANAWAKNIAELSKKYTIYVPDLPGFGLSQSIEGDYYIPQMVDFVEKFTRTLGLENFHLMGHSLGGGVALHYTLRYPEKIRKLVLVSSLCLGREIAWWIRMLSLPVIRRFIFKAGFSTLKGLMYVARIFSPWELIDPITKASVQVGSCIASFTEQTIVLLSQLPKIMVPTLVVWGARDPIVPCVQAYTAAELIPDCQVTVFEDAGHSVYRQRLREFSHKLAEFLG
jgi:pimeloyl-ACP methyl ester carboxylesterase